MVEGMTFHRASHEHDDELFESLKGLAREGAASLGSYGEIPPDQGPLAHARTEGSLDDGFELDVEIADARLA